jgi:hypothetical protein
LRCEGLRWQSLSLIATPRRMRRNSSHRRN